MMRMVTAIIAIAFGAMTAQAAPPSASVFTMDYSWSLPCDGYSLTAAHSAEVRETIFFNSDGITESMQYHLKGSVEVFRDGFPDNVLSGINRNMQKFDLATGIFEVNGGNIRVVLPSYGPILFEAGRWIVDISGAEAEYLFFAGIHQMVQLELDAVCEYFR